MNRKVKLSVRIITVTLFVGIMLYFFSTTVINNEFVVDTPAKEYYIANGFADTGAQNLVTAIYLDYRLYDSIFEAGILLVTVSGLIFMAKKDEEDN